MNGPEIHPAVDANNVQAHRNAEAFSDATRKAVLEATVLAEAKKRHNRKRATRSLLIRAVLSVALIAGLMAAEAFGLIVVTLAIPLECAVMVWFAVWFGAWCQYMWGKEGLLK